MGAQLQAEDEHLFQSSSSTYQSSITKFEEKLEDKPELSANGDIPKKPLEGVQTSILSPYERFGPKYEVIYENEKNSVTVFKVTFTFPIDNKNDPMYGHKEFVIKSTKIGSKDQKKIDHLIREYYIGRTFGCCSENVAKVLDMKSKVDQDGGRVIEILSEYGGQSLRKQKDTLKKGDAARMMFQLVNILALMEEVGVAHNDIKPENLVWNPATGVLKVIDFGSSISMFQKPETVKKTVDAFHAKQFNGCTKYFAPPELLQEILDVKKYVPQKVDAFCFAMTFITMLFYEHRVDINTLPPRGKTEKELAQYVKKVKEILDKQGEDAWVGLFCGCLAYEPNGRLAFSAIKEKFDAIVERHHPELIRPIVESKVDELKLAEAYFGMSEYNVAVWFYEKALEKDCRRDEKELRVFYEHLGYSYARLRRFKKAKFCLKKSINICLDTFCANHRDVAWLHICRGNVYKSFGKHDSAINDYSKAIEMIKKITGTDWNWDTMTVSSALGDTYKSTKDFDEALKHYHRALAIGKGVLGEKSPDVAKIYSSLGDCWRKSGDYDKAGHYLEKAKQIEALINKSSHGSPEFLGLYINLGCYYKETNKYEESKKFYSQALEITKEKFGEEDLGLADLYSKLGDVHTSLEEFKEADQYRALALEIRVKIYRCEMIAQVNDGYSNDYQGNSFQEDNAVAIESYSKALEIRRKMLDEAQPDITKTRNQLGTSYSSLGDNEHSIEFYLNALKTYEKMDATKEEDIGLLTAITNGNLGKAYQRSNKNEDAVAYLEKSLKFWEDVPGYDPKSIRIATLWYTLGVSYRNLGRYEEAIPCMHRSINIYKEAKRETDDNEADVYMELAESQNILNKFDDAIDSCLQALKIRKTNHGKVHAGIAETCLHLGENYLMTNRFKLALQYFGESEEIYKQLPEFGSKHEKVAHLYQLESETYLKFGNIGKSTELAAMAKSILP